MKDKILVKKLGKNTEKELESINFSADYIKTAEKKFLQTKIKIFNLKPSEANILKQTCLSLGFDAAINRDAVTCKCEYSDAIVSGSVSQMEKLCEKLKKQPFRLKSLADGIKNTLKKEKSYIIRDKKFDFSKTYLMGILNVTPDSFSDGGINYNTETAVASALQMLKDGAAIIDIGGESTRPNAKPVTWQTECKRILPVIEKIRTINKNAVISVDTIHPETALKALKAGADILNTVENIEKFEKIFKYLSEHKIPVVITHSKGIPPQKTEKDFEGDITEEIFKYFCEKTEYLKSKGLTENLFILDAGIGFGKSVSDQFEIVKRADELFVPDCPLLFGISRKSFISETFGEQNRDEITKIYSQHLMTKGINILRVHNVKIHSDLQKYLNKIL